MKDKLCAGQIVNGELKKYSGPPPLPWGFVYCPKCGEVQTTNVKVCTVCGGKVA